MPLNETKGNMYNHKLPEVNELWDLYDRQNISTMHIAAQFNVTPSAVANKLKRSGYKLRAYTNTSRINRVELSAELLSTIDGLLLGDGSMCFAPSRKSANYKHSDKQHSFLKWLIEKLSGYNIKFANIYQDKHTKCFQVGSKHYYDFIEIRHRWYPSGEKFVPLDFSISPNALKLWYIGDGNYKAGRNNTRKGERVSIAMQFDEIGKERLSIQLLKLGIDNSIYPDSIYIKAQSRSAFFAYMLSEDMDIPPCYKYKFEWRPYDAIK